MSNGSRVVVLKGGWCAEQDVSRVSGAAAAAALREEGFEVEEIDLTRTLSEALQASFGGKGPDVVFNALHGPFGEDGKVQAVCEMLDIPYTHSGVLASALAMDKPKAKAVLHNAGLRVPGGNIINVETLTGEHPMPLPYVLKPIGDGSSFGVFIIASENQSAPRLEELDADLFGDVAMVEPFIPGREVTVSVLGERALGVTEIIPKGTFYDFSSKYDAGGSKHVLPADIPGDVAEEACRMAVAAAKALAAKGLSRTDFRWDDRHGINGLFILEVNTQPGLTPTSLAPEQAAAVGIPFNALVRWLVEDASCPR